MSEESFNPSRIHPKLYVKDIRCRQAIVVEMDGLMKPDGKGISALSVIKLDCAEARAIKKVRSTLIVKQKMSAKFKARLCIRGDTISTADETRNSSPTPHRASSRILVALMTAARMRGVSVDISQAFLQAGEVPMAERLIILAPNCIELPWKKLSRPIITRQPEEQNMS